METNKEYSRVDYLGSLNFKGVKLKTEYLATLLPLWDNICINISTGLNL